MVSQGSLACLFVPAPRPSPLHLCGARYPAKENGLQKASKSISDKSCSHCQWTHWLTKPHSFFPHSESQAWFHAGPKLTVWNERSEVVSCLSCYLYSISFTGLWEILNSNSYPITTQSLFPKLILFICDICIQINHG